MRENNTIVMNSEDLWSFISSIPGGALRCSIEGKLKWDRISNGMLNIVECPREMFLAEDKERMDSLLYPEDLDIFTNMLFGNDILYEWKALEHRVITCFGKVKWVLSRCKKMVDQEGTEWIYLHMEDIDKKKTQRLKFIEESRLDPLTGLYNREYTKEQVAHYLATEGKDKSNAFLIVDIDNFKKVNNQLGHLFGDGVLTNIANMLKNVFYKTDIVGRVGGDEFAVFIKDIIHETLLEDKAKEVKRIFESAYSGEGKELRISCSIGVARYPEDGTSYGELFKCADASLFAAKGQRSLDQMCLEENGEYYYPYKMETELAENALGYRTGITNFAFDIMENTKDVNSAMKLLLEKIGNHYNGSFAGIFEDSKGKESIEHNYRWGRKTSFTEKSEFTHQDFELLQEELYLFRNNGTFPITDCRKLMNDSCLKKIFSKSQAKSALLCTYYEDGQFRGCVYIEDNVSYREWTNQEINDFITITKIISFYLLKLRVSEEIQDKLDRIQNYDNLTGLPTLYKFKNDTRKRMLENPDGKYAIIYSDISNFKQINDSLGYAVGDQILSCYAQLLRMSRQKDSFVARVSADNFIAMISYDDVSSLQECVLTINEQFYGIQKEKTANCNCFIISGVCLIEPNDENIMIAIDNANIARKSVKGSSRTVCKFFDMQMQTQIKKELEIINNMEVALDNHEFVVYLQPKIRLENNEIVGAEALVRWRRQNGMMLPPDDFIPLFERNGFIVNVDFYVYEEVCKLLRRWLDQDWEVIPISVNVSRVHLNNENFVKKVIDLVDKYDIPPNLLELELTESIFLDNTEVTLSIMKKLRSFGFGVSIDDFGAGYSSLSLLKNMTTDVLKLDKEFFGHGEMQKEEQIIVSSIISMAKQLNMKVLSEGVETQIQSDFLKKISCDMAQGYLFAKPMPICEFERLMKKQGRLLNKKSIYFN